MKDLLILSDPVSNFWKCPKRGLKKYFFGIFYPHFLTCLVLSDLLKLFKSPASWHECRPIYGLHFVYIGFLSFIKKGVLGSKKFHSKFLAVFGNFGHQNG